MNRLRALFTTEPHLILLIALSLLALAPLAAPGYFYGAHDGRHSVFYVEMFDQAIRSGALWPRWAMHHAQGYGYPTFVLQAPLAFYMAEFFVLLGVGVTGAVKLAWTLGFLLGAWGMYALVRSWTGGRKAGDGSRLAALVAGLLYVFIPYHLLDMYVRAAFAETMMMAWFPWALLAFDRLILGGAMSGWQGRLLLAALSLAAVLLTHVFALIAFTPLLAVFVLFRLIQRGLSHPSRLPVRTTLLAAAAGVSGLLLSAVFLLPLLAEGPLLDQEVYTRAAYDYQRNWVYFGQFFNPFWGYGFSDDPTGVNDGMGFQVGVMPLLLAIAGFYLLGEGWRARRRGAYERPWTAQHTLLAFLLLASLGVLFVMTPASAPLWRMVPMVAVIQFPWRLLALSSLTLSAAGGLTVYSLLSKTGRSIAPNYEEVGPWVVAFLVMAASYGYAQPEKLEPVEPWREDGRAVAQFEEQHPDMIPYTAQVEERFTTSPMTDVYRQYEGDFSTDALPRLGILQGEGRVLRSYSQGHRFGGEVEMETPGVVQIYLYNYPGWQVTLDGQPVEVRPSPPSGLMEIDAPAGRHTIDIRMGSTPVRTGGMLISGGALLALLGLWLWGRARRQ